MTIKPLAPETVNPVNKSNINTGIAVAGAALLLTSTQLKASPIARAIALLIEKKIAPYLVELIAKQVRPIYQTFMGAEGAKASSSIAKSSDSKIEFKRELENIILSHKLAPSPSACMVVTDKIKPTPASVVSSFKQLSSNSIGEAKQVNDIRNQALKGIVNTSKELGSTSLLGGLKQITIEQNESYIEQYHLAPKIKKMDAAKKTAVETILADQGSFYKVSGKLTNPAQLNIAKAEMVRMYQLNLVKNTLLAETAESKSGNASFTVIGQWLKIYQEPSWRVELDKVIEDLPLYKELVKLQKRNNIVKVLTLEEKRKQTLLLCNL